MTDDKIMAREAEHLLANPAFKGAMDAMKDMLDRNIATVNPDNKEQCVRVVIARQMISGIEREINNFIQNGVVANLIELEAEKQLTINERLTGRVVR